MDGDTADADAYLAQVGIIIITKSLKLDIRVSWK